MNLPRILIAEDEAPQRAELERLLKEAWPEALVSASCADGLEALEAYEVERPDVAFVDLRMPGLGGLELARSMPETNVVFVTAYDDAAVRAFEQGAIDYLLKPVRRERLEVTIARLKSRLRAREMHSRPSDVATSHDASGGGGGGGNGNGTGADAAASLAERLDALAADAALAPTSPDGHLTSSRALPPKPLRWITASLGDTMRLYPIEDVLLFQAQDKYTRVVTTGDDAIIRTSLRELVRMLDAQTFWHIHRSILVRGLAIDFIRRDEAGKYSCTLKGRSESFPVSSAFQRTLRGM